MDRSDLELVTAIRQHGRLSAAADALGVAASVVTRRLSALEGRLGTAVFLRTTRKLSVTAAGETLCERAADLLARFAAVEDGLQDVTGEPAGLLRVASTFGFGRLWVGPALADFQVRHPRVEIQLQLVESLPDLAVEGFDGAVWLWSVAGQRASDWVGRRLARNQRVLVAAPAYLAAQGVPLSPQELTDHRCLVVRENGPHHNVWSLQKLRDKSEVRVRVQGGLASNSGELVRDWCLAGHGIMLRSLWDVAPQLAAGRLVRVLPGYAMADADVQWLAPRQPRTPRRTRLLADFLAERFRGEPWKRL